VSGNGDSEDRPRRKPAGANAQQADPPHPWRTGSTFPINVYDGDRPVCQCQTVSDAETIVRAVNRMMFGKW
jgi:hypothetical protein